MRGKKRPPEERISNVTGPLPPCKVCGEPAAGFHYGVNTCEACKGFFRRSLVRNGDYRCQGAGNCPIGANRRKSCPRCRYVKCLHVGMSKEAIKTGRYTYQKRTQDTLEIKMIERVKQETGLESTQLVDMGGPVGLLRYPGNDSNSCSNSNGINNNVGNGFLLANDGNRSMSKTDSSNIFEVENFVGSNDVPNRFRNSSTPQDHRDSFTRNEFPALPPNDNNQIAVTSRNGSFHQMDTQHSSPIPRHPAQFSTTAELSRNLSFAEFRNSPNASNISPSLSSPHFTELQVSPKIKGTISPGNLAYNRHSFSCCKSVGSTHTFLPENNVLRANLHMKEYDFGHSLRRSASFSDNLPNERAMFYGSKSQESSASQAGNDFTSFNGTICSSFGPNLNYHHGQCQQQDKLRHINTHPLSPHTPMLHEHTSSRDFRSHDPNTKPCPNTELDAHPYSLPDEFCHHSIPEYRPTFISKGPDDARLNGNDNHFRHNPEGQQSQNGLSKQQVHHASQNLKGDSSQIFQDIHNQHQQHPDISRSTMDQDSDYYVETNLSKFGNQTSPVYSGMVTPESLADSFSADGSCSVDHSDCPNSTCQNSPAFCDLGGNALKDAADSCSTSKHHQHGCEPPTEQRPYVYPKEITRVLRTPGITSPLRVQNNQVCKYPPSIHVEILPTFDPSHYSNYKGEIKEKTLKSRKAIYVSETNCCIKGEGEPAIDDFLKRPNLRSGYRPCDIRRLAPPSTSMFRNDPLVEGVSKNKIISHYRPDSPNGAVKENSLHHQPKEAINTDTAMKPTHHYPGQFYVQGKKQISSSCQSEHRTHSMSSQSLSFKPQTEDTNNKQEQSPSQYQAHMQNDAVSNSKSSPPNSEKHTNTQSTSHQQHNKNKEEKIDSTHNVATELPTEHTGAIDTQDHAHCQQASPNKTPPLQVAAATSLSPLSAEVILPALQVWSPVASKKMSAEEMDKIVADLVHSHRRLIYDTNSLSDAFFESKISECKERCTLQDEIFGHMGFVEREEHQRIYNTTGLDVDNRLESLDQVAELMDADIRHIIAFLKTIPGFRSFSLADQTALVKAAMSELFFMAYYRGYFIDHYIVVEATNTYCIHNMALVYPPIFLTKLFAVAGAFRDLKLSFNATVALKALSIFFPDRALISDRYQCEVLFDKYLQCFLHQLRRDFPDSHGRVMARLASQLAELRELQHICHQLWRTEFYQYQAVANRPILMELFTNNY